MDAKPTCHEMRIDRSFSLFQINVISNEHFTVIEDTGVTNEFVLVASWVHGSYGNSKTGGKYGLFSQFGEPVEEKC